MSYWQLICTSKDNHNTQIDFYLNIPDLNIKDHLYINNNQISMSNFLCMLGINYIYYFFLKHLPSNISTLSLDMNPVLVWILYSQENINNLALTNNICTKKKNWFHKKSKLLNKNHIYNNSHDKLFYNSENRSFLGANVVKNEYIPSDILTHQIKSLWDHYGKTFLNSYLNYLEGYKVECEKYSITKSYFNNIFDNVIKNVMPHYFFAMQINRCKHYSDSIEEIIIIYKEKTYISKGLQIHNQAINMNYDIDAVSVAARLVIYIACMQEFINLFKKNQTISLSVSFIMYIFEQIAVNFISNNKCVENLDNMNPCIQMDYIKPNETISIILPRKIFEHVYGCLFNVISEQAIFINPFNQSEQYKIISLDYKINNHDYWKKIKFLNHLKEKQCKPHAIEPEENTITQKIAKNFLEIFDIFVDRILSQTNQILEDSNFIGISKQQMKFAILNELMNYMLVM